MLNVASRPAWFDIWWARFGLSAEAVPESEVRRRISTESQIEIPTSQEVFAYVEANQIPWTMKSGFALWFDLTTADLTRTFYSR